MRLPIMIKLLSCFGVLASLLFHISSADAQQDNVPAPYLYYYSDILNGFVIERADGTDSRLIAQDMLPPSHTEIYQTMWSPSGEWLAVYSSEFGGLGQNDYLGWIISSDGTQRLTMLDKPDDVRVNVDLMAWMPDNDFLFVVQTWTDVSHETITREFLLIDVGNDEVVASQSLIVPYFNPELGILYQWLPDNQGIIIHEINFLDDQAVLLALLADGMVMTEEQTERLYPRFLPDGRVAYLTQDNSELIIRNFVTDTIESYPLELGSLSPDFVNFSPDFWNAEHNVILFSTRQDNNITLWYFDPNMQEVTALMDDMSVLDVPCEQYTGICGSRGMWSADGLYFVLKTNDETHWVFDLNSQMIMQLENIPDYEMMTWSDDSSQLLFYTENDVTVYDVVSQVGTLISRYSTENVHEWYANNFPSPDGRYIGLLSSNIADLRTGSVIELPIHSGASSATGMVVDYDWHSSSRWVITQSNATHAGCCGANAHTVLELNNIRIENRRELTMRWGDIAGWLPDHVIPHLSAGQSESVLQHPIDTVYFEDRVLGVAWQSTGDAVATVTDTGAVFVRDWSRQPLFITNSNCSSSLFGVPCDTSWDDDVIYAGERAWNVTEQTYQACDEICQEQHQFIISADGQWLAQVMRPDGLVVTNQITGEVVAQFVPERSNVTTPFEWLDGRLVMIFEDTVTLFDPLTGGSTSLVSTDSKGYPDRFSVARVSPDGAFIAGASVTAPIHIWHADTGELATVLNWYGYDIAFSPDGEALVAGNGNLVTYWDISALDVSVDLSE